MNQHGKLRSFTFAMGIDARLLARLLCGQGTELPSVICNGAGRARRNALRASAVDCGGTIYRSIPVVLLNFNGLWRGPARSPRASPRAPDSFIVAEIPRAVIRIEFRLQLYPAFCGWCDTKGIRSVHELLLLAASRENGAVDSVTTLSIWQREDDFL